MLSLAVVVLAANWAIAQQTIMSANQIVPTTRVGIPVDLSGEVIGTFDNELALLRDRSGETVLIDLHQDHWSLGIQTGNQITVTGVTAVGDPKPEVDAEKITVTNKRSREQGRGFGKLVDLLKVKQPGDPIGILGRIESQNGRFVQLTDGTYTIAADFIDADFARKYIQSRTPMIYVGVLGERIEGFAGTRSVKVVSIKPLDFYERPGDKLKAMTIKRVSEERNVGSLVRTKGRLIHYIGNDSVPVLLDEGNVAVLRLGEKYQTQPVRAGALVEVVGLVDFETHNEQEYLTLRDARIIP
jgi:uncharacterized protein YdeI (BOF family)